MLIFFSLLFFWSAYRSSYTHKLSSYSTIHIWTKRISKKRNVKCESKRKNYKAICKKDCQECAYVSVIYLQYHLLVLLFLYYLVLNINCDERKTWRKIFEVNKSKHLHLNYVFSRKRILILLPQLHIRIFIIHPSLHFEQGIHTFSWYLRCTVID